MKSVLRIAVVIGCAWVVAACGGSATPLAAPPAAGLPAGGQSVTRTAVTPLSISPTSLVYVTNPALNVVTAYSQGGSGNIAPFAALSGSNTKLSEPFGVAIGSSNLKIYVANRLNNTVSVFPAGASGNMAPAALITCHLSSPIAIAADAFGNVYVANYTGNSVVVFAASANGCATPIQTIAGSNTGLSHPIGIAVRDSKIFVANQGTWSVTVFHISDSGNVTPRQLIQGPHTGLFLPGGLALDTHANLYVTNNANDNQLAGVDSVTVYRGDANGNEAPIRRIIGLSTGLRDPRGIGVSEAGNVYVGNFDTSTVTVYGPTANGNAAPIQTISGTNTLLGPTWGIGIFLP